MRWALSLLLACALGVCRAVSYCGPKPCAQPGAHTFCRYPPGPSPECRGYMDAALSAEEKARVVARLNRRRSQAASGRLRSHARAGNMLKLRWVEELAREAQRWADQCRPPAMPDERDACRDLFSTSVGQCVASVVGEAPGLRVESLVDVWYMQSMLYRGNVTYYVPPMSNVSFYGDFAQMVWARSYMVGCGRSRFMSEVNGRLRSVERLVCNIAPRGPLPSRPLWAPAEPASVCPPRAVPDPQLTALCNYQRDLDASTDVESAMTLEEHILLSIVLEIEHNNALDYQGSLDELYMTKLAVVTMDHRDTTATYYNPMHKRDIIETLGLDENVVKIDNYIVENDINEYMNATRIIVRLEKSTEVEKSTTKKLVLIGRPKSYNIEELNNVDDDLNHLKQDENHHDDLPQRNKPKIERDVYIDYEFVDVTEDNLPLTSESTSTTNVITTTESSRSVTENVNDIRSAPSTESLTGVNRGIDDANLISNITASINDNISNVTENANTTNVTLRADDDYFSDPETVRELQDALERMEKSLEEKPSSSKVRRELRDVRDLERQESLDSASVENLQQVNANDDNRYVSPDGYQISALQEGNKSDKNPMLNMVLKYLPYLKPYQKEILGGAGSYGSTLVISYVLLSFCFVVNFYSSL